MGLEPAGVRRCGAAALVAAAMAFAMSVGIGACTRDNPATCDDTQGDQCKGEGERCINFLCVGPGAGGAGGAGSGGADGNADADDADAAGDATDAADGADAPVDNVPAQEKICTSDAECASGVCVTGLGCRECQVNVALTMPPLGQCPVKRPFCTSDNRCVDCVEATLTKGDACGVADKNKPFCEPASRECKECLTTDDCKTAAKTAPICSIDFKCVGCAVSATQPKADACKTLNPALPVCDATTGSCEQCNKSDILECPDFKAPVCVSHKCVGCTTDEDCEGRGPKLCLIEPDAKTGRCATAEETIVVHNNPTMCSANGNGMTTNPICRIGDALRAVTGTRRVLLVKGPQPQGAAVIDQAGGPLYIIGREGANILPSIDPGISVRNIQVDVRVRGITINGGGSVGVLAEGAATIRMNRCTITNNAQGGLSVLAGAGFDVSNSVLAGNDLGVIGITTFAGAYLTPPAAGRPQRFRFNTIVDNKGTAVVCTNNNIEVIGLLTARNSPEILGCKVTESRSGEEPQLGADYHLTANSPCLNKASAANAPPDDIDGQARSQTGPADCGADEVP